MSSYSGDVVGSFVWEYEEDDEIFRHSQDPFLLQRYGGKISYDCEWEGCECLVKDNNHPYCMDCYDSVEEHKSDANSNDLKRTCYDIRILREVFEERVRPWLQENKRNIEEYVRSLSFKMLDDVTYYDEWDCIYTSNNIDVIQEYCFLRQIEYYFDHSLSNLCWYHIYQ